MIFKSIKKAFLWTGILLLLLVLFLGGGYVGLRSARVQTRITQYVADVLSDELHAEVAVKGVDVGFFNRLILQGLLVRDLKGDTLAYLPKLHLGLRQFNLDAHQADFDLIRLDGMKFFLRKYKGESKLNIQFLIDYFSREKKENPPKWTVHFKKVELRDAEFRLKDQNVASRPRGINYKGLDVDHINLLIDDIRIDADTVYGNIASLNCLERSGFFIKQFQGNVKVSAAELDVSDLKILTEGSNLDLDLHYAYSGWTDYKHFVDSVRMDYDFRTSEVDMADVAYFAHGLEGLNEKLRLSGHVYGTVSSMNGRGLNIWYGNSTNLQGDIDLDGLPNIPETFIFLDLKRLTTNYADISSMPLPPFTEKRKMRLPTYLRNLGLLDFKGNFTGFVNDFVAYGKLSTGIGQIRTDILLKQDNASGTLTYDGSLKTIDLDIGKLLGQSKVGRVSLDANVVGSGLSKESLSADLVGNVSSAKLMSYEYRNIDLNGTFSNSRFNGALSIADTNVNIDFLGEIDVSQNVPRFNFHSDVHKADLYELNLLRNRANATVSGVLDVNFEGNDIDNILGNIRISDASYQQKGDKRYKLKELDLNISQDSVAKMLVLNSDVLDAELKGVFNFRNLPRAINNLMQKHLPSYSERMRVLGPEEGLEFDFDMDFKNTELLTYFLMPDLAVSDSSTVKGNYSSSQNQIFLRGRFPEITFRNNSLKNVRLEADNPGKEFGLALYADTLNLIDSLYVKDLSVSTFTFNDSLGLVVKWDNGTQIENSGFIQGTASFPRNEQVSFRLLPSRIVIAGMPWAVSDNNLLTIDSSTFTFSHFRVSHDREYIGLNGIISKDADQKLLVRVNRFNLSNVNTLSRKKGVRFNGTVTGEAQVSGLYSKLFVTDQLTIDSLQINEVNIGSGDLNTTWIPATRTVQVFGLLQRDGLTSLSLVGEILTGEDRDQNFNIKASIDSIPLSVFNPYVKKVISDISGTMKASLRIRGTFKQPELEGMAVLQNAGLLLNYLNTRYTISDTVLIKKDGFYLEDLRVQDEREKEGRINGWIKHDNFKNFHFDADLEANDFLALNTNSAVNQLYYGKAYGTGVVSFSGSPKDMHLDVAMRTDHGTRFHIPLFGASSVDESNFLTFVKPEGFKNPENIDQEFQVDFKNITLDLDIEVTPDAEVQLIFDPKVGDIIKGKGTGDIRMSLDRSGTFKMFGDYYINKGEYLFTLQNLINKKFLIQQGGTISWNGSPYDALVDIEAIYGVRTSLFDLMYPADTSDVYKRRVQVNCVLKMTDNLLNPNISFDIDLPNSDETVKTEVQNRIGIGNEQEMNRQVFGLLVLNKFFPTQDQNLAQETGGFFTASSAELLSNQLSNWLSKISNDFDIGLNYRPGNNITNDELELALSTQIFNNRIIIDGNVGVANTQANSSSIVGDVNIEYKITSDGRFRVKAFNKSNDMNANTYTKDAPFTQGIGISYQKEFDYFGELFRKRVKETKASGRGSKKQR